MFLLTFMAKALLIQSKSNMKENQKKKQYQPENVV